MTLDDTKPLRNHVAKREGLRDVPDAFWNKPITRQFVQLWASAPSDSQRREMQERVAGLIREDIKAFKAAGGDTAPWTIKRPKGQGPTEVSLAPGDSIALRAEALCVYWAKLAEARRDVRSFRAKVLGGTKLSAEEARRLIASPASAVLMPKLFAKHDIPVHENTAELDVIEQSHPLERPYELRARLRVQWPTGETVIKVSYKKPALPAPMEIWDGVKSVLVQPWTNSLLGLLCALASKLIERYPWEPMFAAWFVLTGEPPWVPPLTATSSGPDLAKNHGTITIRAAHWVPEQAIRELYLKMKSGMHATHTTSERRLALFLFVTERSTGVNELDKGVLVTGLRTPPWRSLQGEWNVRYPSGHKWHYVDVRNLRRDFLEASKLLVGY